MDSKDHLESYELYYFYINISFIIIFNTKDIIHVIYVNKFSIIQLINIINDNIIDIVIKYILKNASAGSRTRVSCLEGSDLTVRPQMQSINKIMIGDNI